MALRAVYPEFSLRRVVFSFAFIFFGSWFPILIVSAGWMARNVERGMVIAMTLLIFFSFPFFVLMRGTYRMLRDELRYQRAMKPHPVDSVAPQTVEIYQSLVSSTRFGGARIEFIVIDADEPILARFSSPAAWFPSFPKVSSLKGLLHSREQKPIMFESGRIRIWLDHRRLEERADSKVGRAFEKAAERIARIRSKT